MKVKIGFVALLTVVLTLGLSLTSYAAIVITNNVDAANEHAPGAAAVVGSFTVTFGLASDQITTFEPTTAGSLTPLVAADIVSLKVYEDINGDGKLDSKDVEIGAASAGGISAWVGGGAASIIPDPVITVTVAGDKDYIVVAQLAEKEATAKAFDNAAITTGLGVNTGAVTPATTADIIKVTATHLQFVASKVKHVISTGTAVIQAADGDPIIYAVGDWGNVDEDFNSTDIRFSLENFTLQTLDPLVLIDAADGAGTPVDLDDALGASVCAGNVISSGVVTWNQGTPAANVVQIIDVTCPFVMDLVLVVKEATKNLEGSISFAVTATGADKPGIGIAAARGIEVYDVNHNGHIDHATVYFDAPIDSGTLPAVSEFTIGSGYEFVGTASMANFDAGGTGIRNAGPFGVTLRIKEKTVYDTAVSNGNPSITYTGSTLKDKLANTFKTVGAAEAVEVDKARPILLTKVTSDTGIGAGDASNGKVDGIIFTFSETVRNVTAGLDTTYALSIEKDIVFNQGSGSVVGSVVTIPVGETIINTGIEPNVKYNEVGASAPFITDFARAATLAAAYNNFYAKNTEFNIAVEVIAVSDGAPMVVHSVATKEATVDGLLDQMVVTFSEDATVSGTGIDIGVSFYSDITIFASEDDQNGEYRITGAPSGGGTNIITFNIVPLSLTGVYDTEAKPVFQYNKSADGSIKDDAGIELSDYGYGSGKIAPPATSDGAAPYVVSVKTADSYIDTARVGDSSFESGGANGRIDTVVLTFSEMVKTSGGAQDGGTALDDCVGQITVDHALVDPTARTLIATGALYGKPKWDDTDENGETETVLTMSFQEIPYGTSGMINNGDTGELPALTYTEGTSSRNIVDYADTPNKLPATSIASTADGASPFIVDGLDKLWHGNAFANVVTLDVNENVTGTRDEVSNTANGNGYIDGFVLKFSESVSHSIAAADLGVFTVDLPGAGALVFAAGSLTASGTELTLTGVPDEKGDPDTDVTPALSFDAKKDITDGDGNKLAAFTDKLTYDKTPPVIVSVNGAEDPRALIFTFSEPIWGHDAAGKNVSFNDLTTAGSSLYGYQNLSVGLGSSGITAANVTQVDANKLGVTLNADLTVADIEADLIWPKADGIYDDANAVETGLTDNVVIATLGGSNLKINIFDDVIAPWIIAAQTVDVDGNGLIDHIRFGLSENIDDATIKGYVSGDAMSDDVSATWKVSGYAGTAMWNLFDGTTDAGKLAAAAAGKPAFTDNAKNDAVLYLELEEGLVPVYTVTGMGSTGFAPTVTWGTAADAVTLGDFRPNVLDTAADTTKDPDSIGGVVSDKVGPVLMAAEYGAAAAKAATEVGGTVTLSFSEAIKEIDKALKTDDFDFSGDEANIYGFEWLNAGTLELTMKSSYSFPAGSFSTVKLADNRYFKDVSDNVAVISGAPYADVMWYEAVSPIADPPYKEKPKTVGAVTISGLPVLAFSKFVPSTLTAGEPVDILWTYANVENVVLYISFNGGVDWTLEDSATPAADGQLTWIPQLNATTIKLQAVEDATINSGSVSCGVVLDFNSNTGGPGIGAPADLTIMDLPDDNGGFVIAQFTVSKDHLTAVNSYQFYREMALDDADPNDITQVQWATIAAGTVDENNMMSVIVPTVWNGISNWVVRASTSSYLSDGVASKGAGLPVATVVYGGAAKAASGGDVLSASSNVVVGGSIDNIAPSAFIDFTVADNAGEGTGILLSWTVAEDHGIVGSYVLASGTGYIYGVDQYEVYRKAKGTDTYTLVDAAGPLSTSFVDEVEDGATVYNYYLKAVDGNPEHLVETGFMNAIATSDLTGDFNGDRAVGFSDFSIFAANYGITSDDVENFVLSYDLNGNGVIDFADFSIFAASYGETAKVAKAIASMPTSDIPFGISAEIDESTSMYYVNVNIGETESLKGFQFFMSYNTDALEFVEDSVSGLVGLNMMDVETDGLIRVASEFVGEAFNGTVTLGFKSTGMNSDLTFEIVNAMVDDLDGVAMATNLAEYTARALPTVYALSQNYPNPFNPTTTIDYSIPKSGNVELVIFNMAGQKVRTLVNSRQDAAFYKVVWDGRNDNGESVASGLYFYRIVSGNFSKIDKMTLIK